MHAHITLDKMADILAAFEGTIRQLIHRGGQVSQYLSTASNSIRGLSARSVRRFKAYIIVVTSVRMNWMQLCTISCQE